MMTYGLKKSMFKSLPTLKWHYFAYLIQIVYFIVLEIPVVDNNKNYLPVYYLMLCDIILVYKYSIASFLSNG